MPKSSKAEQVAAKEAQAAQLTKTRQLIEKGWKAPNGIKVIGFTKHGVQRPIGDAERLGVKPSFIIVTITKPLKIDKVKIYPNGLKSQRLTGKYCSVVVNPDTGLIVSVNPISSKKKL